MPRYFFHLQGSGAQDLEGQELSDDETARQEAKAVARELARNRMFALEELVVIRNADGKIIHQEPL